MECRRIKGISYASVCNEKMEKLVLYKDMCVEFPCDSIEHTKKLILMHGGKYSLHYPSAYSVGRYGFFLSDKEERRKIFADLSEYVKLFPQAEYILCHFPGMDPDQTWEEIEEIFGELYESVKGIPDKVPEIVIENLSFSPCCKRALDYQRLLDQTDLGFCLDVGHAHLVAEEEVFSFIRLLGHRIRVVHFYNTSNDEKSIFYGEHLPKDFQIEKGIHIGETETALNKLKQKIYMIDESKG